MLSPESPPKLFVNASNQVPIICPKCNFSKLLQLQTTSKRNRVLKLICKCKHSFKVQLEFRQYARKETSLKGTFTLIRNKLDQLPVKVVNLSRGGACLELSFAHDCKIGEKGTLTFTLDDKLSTVINKEIIIKSLHPNRIGCEFINSTEYDRAFGFYLAP